MKGRRSVFRYVLQVLLILIACLFCLWLIVKSAAAQSVPDSVIQTAVNNNAQPVRFNNDTLFYLSHRSGPMLVPERVKRIETRLLQVVEDPFFKADSIRVVVYQNQVDVSYKDNPILTVQPVDTQGLSVNQLQLADSLTKVMQKHLVQFHQQHQKKLWLYTSLEGLIILGLLAFSIGVVIWLFQKLNQMLVLYKDRWCKGLKIGKVKFLLPDQELKWVLNLVDFFKWLSLLVLLYIALLFIFRLFPWTQPLGQTLYQSFTQPIRAFFNRAWDYLPNVFIILFVWLLTRFFIGLLRQFREGIKSSRITVPGFYPEWAQPTFTLLRIGLWVLFFLEIYPFLPGSDTLAFKGLTVFMGLLVSIGSVSSLANIVAGIILIYTRSFKVGDRIQVGDVIGDVTEKTMLATQIRTSKNEIITMPNTAVLNTHVRNFSTLAGDRNLILHTTVTIGYQVPWRQVHDLLINAAQCTYGIEKEPKPFVLQTALNDFYVSYQLNGYTSFPNDMINIYSRLHQNIQDVFFNAGVEIMSPHYSALRDGNTSAIPPDKRNDGSDESGFRIKQG